MQFPMNDIKNCYARGVDTSQNIYSRISLSRYCSFYFLSVPLLKEARWPTMIYASNIITEWWIWTVSYFLLIHLQLHRQTQPDTHNEWKQPVAQGTHMGRDVAVTQKQIVMGLGDHWASWSISGRSKVARRWQLCVKVALGTEVRDFPFFITLCRRWHVGIELYRLLP